MKRYIRNIVEVDGTMSKILAMAPPDVGIDYDDNKCYQVNPSKSRRGDPYFKVYNNHSFSIAREVARIAFREPRYIVHQDESGKQPFHLSNSEKERMCTFLHDHEKFTGISYWQYAMYQWNKGYGFIVESGRKGRDHIAVELLDFLDGKYDTERNLSNPSYLRHDLPIPDYMQLSNVSSTRKKKRK